MTILNCTLLNFARVGTLAPIFENYSNDFEYTTNGVFRRIVSPNVPKFGHQRNHNGYNEHCKKRTWYRQDREISLLYLRGIHSTP